MPLSGVRENRDHLRLLEEWMRSYRPEELFDADGTPVQLVREANPPAELRMSASPHANGGLVSRPLDLPNFRDFSVPVDAAGSERAESTRQLGSMLAEIYRRNPDRFRLFCPDETNSNRLGAVFDVSDRAFMERIESGDVPDLARRPRDGSAVRAQLPRLARGIHADWPARHVCDVRAFAMVSASQTVQHSKWLEEAGRLPWRARIPSLNVLLTSTAWRNDHNGFSHQGPGLIQIVLTHAAKSHASISRQTRTACSGG